MHTMEAKHILKTWMERNDVSMTHLAELAGINHSVLVRILNGNTKQIRPSTAKRIARATLHQVRAWELLGLEPVYVAFNPSGVPESTVMEHKETAPYKEDARVFNTLLPLPPPELKSSENTHPVFTHWVEEFGKKRAKLNAKRMRAIKRALDDWSEEDLKRSISGHSSRTWRHEAPERCELVTLLRPENIEGGLELAPETGQAQAEDTSYWDSKIEEEEEWQA